MEIVDIKDEFKNSKILLIILGVLFIPVINSLDSLLFGFCKMSGLSIKSILMLSILLHGIIIVFVLFILYWIISFRIPESIQPKFSLTQRTLKNWGIISFFILIAGSVINLYVKKYYDEIFYFSKIESEGLTTTEIAYLSMILSGLTLLRNVLLFTVYFVIAFKRKLN